MISCTDRRLVHSFFFDRLGLHWSEDFRGVLHVPEANRGDVMRMEDVAIAVGFNGFIGRTCCMHAVIQRPDLVSPRLVRETFEFPFLHCDCEAVLGFVDSTNDAALSFDRRLGFKDIAVIPNGGPDADLIILRMMRADCRWLRKH